MTAGATAARFLSKRAYEINNGEIEMKSKTDFITTLALVVVLIASAVTSAAAQGGIGPNTKSKIQYHGGSVMVGASNAYLIWYGCWTNSCGDDGSTVTREVIEQFAVNIGSTPYFAINSSYPMYNGHAPSGSLLLGGIATVPTYTHGTELTENDIKAIVADQIDSGALPPDPAGIYIVLASGDVGSTATGLCSAVGTTPLHGTALPAIGTFMRYGFLGNPNRCPSIAGPQFVTASGTRLPTPNGDFAADVMASDLAHLFSVIVTNPNPDISYLNDGWYDRYGLENADKCQGTFGTTYATATGARANVRWGGRDYLVQQNWVNDRKGHCGMTLF